MYSDLGMEQLFCLGTDLQNVAETDDIVVIGPLRLEAWRQSQTQMIIILAIAPEWVDEMPVLLPFYFLHLLDTV